MVSLIEIVPSTRYGIHFKDCPLIDCKCKLYLHRLPELEGLNLTDVNNALLQGKQRVERTNVITRFFVSKDPGERFALKLFYSTKLNTLYALRRKPENMLYAELKMNNKFWSVDDMTLVLYLPNFGARHIGDVFQAMKKVFKSGKQMSRIHFELREWIQPEQLQNKLHTLQEKLLDVKQE